MYRGLLLHLLARCKHSFIALHTRTHTHTTCMYIYIYIYIFNYLLSVCPPIWGKYEFLFFLNFVPSIFTHFLFQSLYFPHLSYSLSIFQRNSKGVWLNLLNVFSVIRFITLYAIVGVLLLSVNIWKHQFHICVYCYLQNAPNETHWFHTNIYAADFIWQLVIEVYLLFPVGLLPRNVQLGEW